MKREKLEDWARQEFIKLLGAEGDGIWNDAEDVLKRKRLLEFVPQEGRVNGRFSGEKPIRCQLIAPIYAGEEKKDLFSAVTQSTLSSAILMSDKLPWSAPEFEKMLSPASFIPVNFGNPSQSAAEEAEEASPGRYNSFSCALYLELLRRFEADPSLIFTVRGLNREELITIIRESRSGLWQGIAGKISDEAENSGLEKEVYESAKPELFDLTFQLRADELPALLFKRVEGIPLSDGAEVVDSVLTDLYAHIAKRAQAYGLSMGSRISSIIEEQEEQNKFSQEG